MGRIQHGTSHSTRIQPNDLIDATPPTASFAPNEIEHEYAGRIAPPETRPSSHLGPESGLILSLYPFGSGGTPNESSMTSSHRGSTPSSLQNGVCIPQRRYKAFDYRPLGDQILVSFLLRDGSYLPVDAALRRQYTGLIGRDSSLPYEAHRTLMLRLEVK